MLQIITNHHKRQFTYRYDVPESILTDQFDHLDEDEGFDGFFEYRGYWYHTSDFLSIDHNNPFDKDFHYWDGHAPDSFFSAVLIKLSDDGETYQIATYLS